MFNGFVQCFARQPLHSQVIDADGILTDAIQSMMATAIVFTVRADATYKPGQYPDSDPALWTITDGAASLARSSGSHAGLSEDMVGMKVTGEPGVTGLAEGVTLSAVASADAGTLSADSSASSIDNDLIFTVPDVDAIDLDSIVGQYATVKDDGTLAWNDLSADSGLELIGTATQNIRGARACAIVPVTYPVGVIPYPAVRLKIVGHATKITPGFYVDAGVYLPDGVAGPSLDEIKFQLAGIPLNLS